MAIVSAPPEHMTATAAGLLAAAAELGYPATAVATTGDTPLGLGFSVPDDVAERWHAAGKLQVPVTVATDFGDTEALAEVAVAEVTDVTEDPEPGPGATEEPVAPAAPAKRGPRGPRKPATTDPEV